MNDFNFADAKKARVLANVSLTKCQEIALEGILEFINADYDPRRPAVALTGAAGTGKSFTVKTIISLSGFSHSVIGLSAPTHKAARVLAQATNLRTSTIQSDLGLRINMSSDNFDVNNPPFDPLAEKKINKYQLYIVDEASMISRSIKTLLEREAVLSETKIIYVGDEYQLPPVGESYSSAFSNIKLYNLKQVVRQGENNPVSDILEILRKDIKYKTFNFLYHIQRNRHKFNDNGSKGFSVHSRDEFKEVVSDVFSNEAFTRNVDLVRLTCYTNRMVSSWNNFIRHRIVQDADTSVITKNDLINSYKTMLDNYGSPIITNSEDYIIKKIINYRSGQGIEGFLIEFVCVYGGDETPSLFVVDHNNRASLKRYYDCYMNLLSKAKTATVANRGRAWGDFYKFKDQNLLLVDINDSIGKLITPRDLDYGFAFTANRSQGSTFDDVCVDINDIMYDRNGVPYTNVNEMNRRLYVAISRCRNRAILCYGT